MRRALLFSFGGAFVGGFLLAACGADNVVAPRGPAPSDTAQCRGFDQLMPNFVRAISTGATQNLKLVVEQHLLQPAREGEAPPVNDVMRSIFFTLDAFAREPAEPGAAPGQLCADLSAPASWPTLAQANDLCELRRANDLLVHRGGGVDAIDLLQPVLLGVFDYLSGAGKDHTPHYEVAAVFSGLCAQDYDCQLSNGLELVSAFTDYARTPDGKKLFDDLQALVAKPSVNAFLDPAKFREDDFVLIAKVLIPVIDNADPTALDALFSPDGGSSLPLPAELLADLAPIVADLKTILGHRELMTPIRKALHCVWGQAPQAGSPTTCWSGKDGCNFEVLRMLHRLAIRDALPEFGITRLTQVLQSLQAADPRGSLVFVLGTLARAVRSDDRAIDSAADVCRTLLSTTPQSGQARPNAELVVPVLAELVRAGVVQEAICAVDTLLYGCAGGAQPACR